MMDIQKIPGYQIFTVKYFKLNIDAGNHGNLDCTIDFDLKTKKIKRWKGKL